MINWLRRRGNFKFNRSYRMAYIEPVRGCPIRCIPCPIGRPALGSLSPLVLSIDLAEKCLLKLRKIYKIKTIYLGNWGEPLLHPNINDLVSLARKIGFDHIGVSTSLSVNISIEDLVKAGFDCIQISISGMTKDIYNVSHRHGNFDLVFQNLEKLSEAIELYRKDTNVAIRWHRYRHNESQLENVKSFCNKHNFSLLAYYGHLGSIEALQDWTNSRLEEPLSGFVHNSVNTNFVTSACKINENATECGQSDFLVVDADGTLIFCCSCYMKYKKNIDFLGASRADVEKFKILDSSMCKECLAKGWAGYMNRPKTLEEYGSMAIPSWTDESI